MQVEKLDPRTERTRVLIKNAFIALVRKKDFNEITVKDIAEKATVNRATFYAHFADKYELLDSAIIHSFQENMMKRITCYTELNPSTIAFIIIVLCESHKELSSTYTHSYSSLGPIIEAKFIEELRKALHHLLHNRFSDREEDAERMATLDTAANVLSWSMYGVTYTWNRSGRVISPEELADKVVPILTQGLVSREVVFG